MNLASRWSYFCTYLQRWSEFVFVMDGGRGGGGERSEHVPRVVYETLKY